MIREGVETIQEKKEGLVSKQLLEEVSCAIETFLHIVDCCEFIYIFI